MNKELTDQAVLNSRLHFQLVQPHIPRHINKKNYTIVTCHRNMRQSLSLSLKTNTSQPWYLGFSPWGNSLHQLQYPQSLSLQPRHQLSLLNLSISLGQWFHNGPKQRWTAWLVRLSSIYPHHKIFFTQRIPSGRQDFQIVEGWLFGILLLSSLAFSMTPGNPLVGSVRCNSAPKARGIIFLSRLMEAGNVRISL